MVAKGSLKKTAAIIGGILLVLLVIGAMGSGSAKNSDSDTKAPEVSTQPQTETSSQNEASVQNEVSVITTPTKDILGAWSQQLPTEYRLGTVDSIGNDSLTPSKPNGDANPNYINGIVEGSKQTVTKVSGNDNKQSVATVYRFSDANSAEAYYLNKTNEVIQRRGYSEVSTNSLSSRCFGFETKTQIYDIKEAICVKGNVVFDLKVSGTMYVDVSDSDLIDNAKALEKLIK